MPMSIPYVIEKSGREERVYDLFSRLMKDRNIFIGMAIDDTVANVVVAQLLFLQFEDREAPVNIYVNCPGGWVTAGLAIYDTMRYIDPPVCTYCIGQAASMGAVLLAAGDKGKRFALPNARVLIHQPSGQFSGTASDINIQASEILKLKKRLTEILVYHTGQPADVIERDTDRDFYMSAEEAVAYGIVDEVLQPEANKKPGKAKKE